MSTPKTYGYQLAVKEVNDAGGIMVDGAKKKIKLVTYDGQSDIKKYQELAQKCIFDDGADVVMAAYTGAEREAARREVVRNKVIFWHNNQGEGGIADHYSFFSGPTPEQQLMPSIKWMIEHFGKRLIYIGADYNFCRAIGMWTRVAAGLNGGTYRVGGIFSIRRVAVAGDDRQDPEDQARLPSALPGRRRAGPILPAGAGGGTKNPDVVERDDCRRLRAQAVRAALAR